VVARSPSAQRLARELGARGDVRIIPHHVPGWPDRKRAAGDRFRIGFAGRLVAEKGLDVLVKAVHQMEGPLELVVAGEGPLRTWLQRQDLGDASLRLLTNLTHGEMPSAYDQMDVLVLPSRATTTWVEQFGRVLVEALWCGVPVIGSDTGEIPWVIDQTGGGMVFPDGDSDSLAACIEQLRKSPEMRELYAKRGMLRSREYFSTETCATKLDLLLRDAAPGRVHRDDDNARPHVALVAHGIHDRGGMERACAELIRRTHGDIRYTVVTAELDHSLRPLVWEWVRIRVPRRPIPLKFILFFCFAGYAIRRRNADLIHTVGAVIPNCVDLVGVHYCHAGARRAFGGLAPPGAPGLRRLNTATTRMLGILAEKWCYRPGRLQVVVPVSSGVAGEIASHYPDIPMVIIENGVDATRFQPDFATRTRVRNAEGLCNEDVVGLLAGGDWDRKGLQIAIEALAIARAKMVPVFLWVVGAGDEGRFKRIASDCGVERFVRFFGRQGVIEAFYQAADIFVLPSLYETFSIVCYEAAASGLPLVATRVSGVSDLIGSDDAGIAVDRNAASVGAALTRLATDGDLRISLGVEARRRAASFTWEASVSKEVALYRQLARSATPADRSGVDN
jgi:glycosyltransferase involved in cell wall biosynthesis